MTLLSVRFCYYNKYIVCGNINKTIMFQNLRSHSTDLIIRLTHKDYNYVLTYNSIAKYVKYARIAGFG